MALKNTTDKDFSIKYNGFEFVIKPGAIIDVRDFCIKQDDVASAELFLSQKYRQTLVVVKMKTAEEVNRELLAKISNLERENSGLKVKIQALETPKDEKPEEETPKRSRK